MGQLLPAAGRPGRLVACRVMPGRDLISGIEEICMSKGVTCGAILCSIGSLERAAFNYVTDLSVREGRGHTSLMELEGPLGLLGGQGVISVGETGHLDVHYHATISGPEDRVYGGHMLKGRCPVLSTVDVIILEMDGVEVVRSRDPQSGIVFTAFRELV